LDLPPNSCVMSPSHLFYSPSPRGHVLLSSPRLRPAQTLLPVSVSLSGPDRTHHS
jgi:hypothetical protein